MRPVSYISDRLEGQSVLPMESTIPDDVTIEGWRNHPLRKHRPAESCGHLCDTTTRYDHDAKLLHFLLVCPTCGTEKLIETQPYEPRFTQHVQDQSAAGGATVHQLPVGRHKRSLRRAA